MRLLLSFIFLILIGCNQEEVVDDRPEPPKNEQQQRYVEGEIIVRYEDNCSEAYIKNMLKTHGASIKQKLPGKQTYLIKLPFGHTVESAVPLYDGLIGVKWAEPNYIYRHMGVPKQPGAIKVKPIKIRKVD